MANLKSSWNSWKSKGTCRRSPNIRAWNGFQSSLTGREPTSVNVSTISSMTRWARSNFFSCRFPAIRGAIVTKQYSITSRRRPVFHVLVGSQIVDDDESQTLVEPVCVVVQNKEHVTQRFIRVF